MAGVVAVGGGSRANSRHVGQPNQYISGHREESSMERVGTGDSNATAGVLWPQPALVCVTSNVLVDITMRHSRHLQLLRVPIRGQPTGTQDRTKQLLLHVPHGRSC